ncbi:MAG: tetratricopeptide repeat protein [Azoarcus sp.]|jgi:tetratricopeptide (TPR) repeat protein|nr:tetratricopeptide repeat protein [Azoarcus sp.]
MKLPLSRYLVLFSAIMSLYLPAAPAFTADAEAGDDPAPGIKTETAADDEDEGEGEDEASDIDEWQDVDEEGAEGEVEDESEGMPSPEAQAFPAQELDEKTLYEFLLAEIAGARGQLKLSAETYLELARRTRDPRIARRAAQFAVAAREPQLVTEAVRQWGEIDPQSQEAKQVAESIARGQGAVFDKFQAFVARALAQNPAKLAPNLMGLNRALLKAEDKDAARKVVYNLTEPYLSRPEAHYARAQASALAKRQMEAINAIDHALELRPDWQAALFIKAHLLTETGNAAKASQLFAEVLERQPGNNDVRLAYARSLIADNRFDAARAEFKTLLAAAPGNSNLLYATGVLSVELGDIAAAEPLLKQALDAGHPEADLIRIQLGKIADTRGAHAAARKWYEAVSPGNRSVEARILGAQSLAKEKRIDQARRFLHAAPNADPEARRRLLLAESQLLANAGRGKEAFALIDKALRAQPDDNDMLYESAMLAERLGMYETMEGRLRKLIALSPDSAHAYNALGYSLIDRGVRLDEAEELVTRALELLPEDPFILDSVGWAHFKRGDLAGALERLEEAYAKRADPEIAAHLGEVLWRLDRSTDARRILDKALTENPGNAPLKETIRRLYRPGKKP